LAGLESYLTNSKEWMIKMEFAPLWLESQGTSPVALLQWLFARYEVVEFPERITYNTHALDSLFSCALHAEQAAHFVDYVARLNSKKRGWVDLLVRPASTDNHF